MISSERAINVLNILEQDGNHKVFVPASEIERYVKDIEVLTGVGIAYDAVPDEGIDIFCLKFKSDDSECHMA